MNSYLLILFQKLLHVQFLMHSYSVIFRQHRSSSRWCAPCRWISYQMCSPVLSPEHLFDRNFLTVRKRCVGFLKFVLFRHKLFWKRSLFSILSYFLMKTDLANVCKSRIYSVRYLFFNFNVPCRHLDSECIRDDLAKLPLKMQNAMKFTFKRGFFWTSVYRNRCTCNRLVQKRSTKHILRLLYEGH